MFEHKTDPVISNGQFGKRLFIAFLVTLAIIAGSILAGIVGYSWIGGMNWHEAFHYTCLSLSGHYEITEDPSKELIVFVGIFTLYGHLVFVSMVAILLVPILHRLLHKLHLDAEIEGLDP